ncbi:MAG: hypothetical protein KatS3mg129_1896 [Leptospiraceae bacterium]|nr:MAG: hypothetical protein KatS3mg129_1896 [Leptospiraceae bacterium]
MAVNLLVTYINMTNSAQNKLDELLKSKILSHSDNAFVKELKKGFYLLSRGAFFYTQYIKTKDKKNLENYDKNRYLIWNKISKLLKIKLMIFR